MKQADKASNNQRIEMIAANEGLTMREFTEMIDLYYIDNEKMKQRVVQEKQLDLQIRQVELMELQFQNELMQNTLLAFRLKRAIWWRKKLGLVREKK